MSKYVVDAYAWVEYLVGSESGIRVRDLLEKGDNEVYTCAVTLAEVVSKAAREGQDTETVYTILLSNSEIVNVDEELSKEAGILHAQIRRTDRDFGLADAYVLATARRTNSKVLTGDPHFKAIKEAILIR